MRLTHCIIFRDLGVKLLPVKKRTKHFLKGYGPTKRHVTRFEAFAEYILGGGNYALVTGTGAAWGHSGGGLVVLDFDDPDLYREFTGNKEPDTFTVKTARGYHVYYWADDVRSFAFDGLDVLGAGRAVLGAHCIHPSGALYEPLNQPGIHRIESVFDFPLLSELEPRELPEPPKAAPKSLQGRTNGRGKVARIKRGLSVLEAVERYAPKAANTIKGSGRWRQYCCAFHDDEHRSGWIDTERGLFGCHGCDVRKGDVISFVALAEGIENRDAIELLGGAL